jgi:hypothetical protein
MAKKGWTCRSRSKQDVSFLVWTWILGPAGAILARPLTMVLRLFLSFSTRARWLGDWLFGSPAEAADVGPSRERDAGTGSERAAR